MSHPSTPRQYQPLNDRRLDNASAGFWAQMTHRTGVQGFVQILGSLWIPALHPELLHDKARGSVATRFSVGGTGSPTKGSNYVTNYPACTRKEENISQPSSLIAQFGDSLLALSMLIFRLLRQGT